MKEQSLDRILWRTRLEEAMDYRTMMIVRNASFHTWALTFLSS